MAEATNQLGSQMLRIGCTAPVAAPKNLVSSKQAIGDEGGRAFKSVLLRFQLADNSDVFPKCVGEDAGQILRRWHSLLVALRM